MTAKIVIDEIGNVSIKTDIFSLNDVMGMLEKEK